MWGEELHRRHSLFHRFVARGERPEIGRACYCCSERVRLIERVGGERLEGGGERANPTISKRRRLVTSVFTRRDGGVRGPHRARK